MPAPLEVGSLVLVSTLEVELTVWVELGGADSVWLVELETGVEMAVVVAVTLVVTLVLPALLTLTVVVELLPAAWLGPLDVSTDETLCDEDVDADADAMIWVPGEPPPLGALACGVLADGVPAAGVDGVDGVGGEVEVGVEETGSGGSVLVDACGTDRTLTTGVGAGVDPTGVRAVPSGVTMSSPARPVPAAVEAGALVPPVSGRLKSAPKAESGRPWRRSEETAGVWSLTVTTESPGVVWLASGQLTPARRWPSVITAAANTPVATTTEAANSTRRRDMYFNIGKNGLQHKGCQSFVH